MTDDIDHSCTSEIVCPYCGYEHEGDYFTQVGKGHTNGEEECDECGKTFKWMVEHDPCYYTEKIEEKTP